MMSRRKVYKILIAIFLIGIASLSLGASQQVVTTSNNDERPFLRILAPKFICPDEKSTQQKYQNVSNRVTIGLQTSEGQRLRYSITIDFDILDDFQSQRHTLSIWKHVRQLQAKFAKQNIADEISLKNQIEIDALELTPQVVYTFKITGYDEKNISSEIQNFTITYKGDELKTTQSNLGDGVSLFLYGSESVRNDAEFLAVADVLFCVAINDYFYQWKIDGLSSDGEDFLHMRGSFLKLPPNILEAEKFYEVRVTIFNNKQEALASLSLPVKVFAKEFEVQNVPASCLIGVSKEVPFSTIFYYHSNMQDISVKWTCSEELENSLINASESSHITASFHQEGNFVLKSTATYGEISKTSSTNVNVNPKVIPHVYMKYFPPQPVSTMENNEFVATIVDLIPRCTAAWTLVNDEGFAEPTHDMSNLGFISIRDYEEHFLNELVDYDNNTLSKDITMTITAGSLKAEEKYKFRLIISCPEPITETMTAKDRKNATTFYDIIVATNGPPKASELDIFPTHGIPMKQSFKFSLGAAKDQPSDYPLKYTFGYKVDNLLITIGSFYENHVAHTQLPYSDSIETFFEVCDNNNACIEHAGPQIASNVSYNYSQAEVNFKLEEIEGCLNRAEYQKVLNSVVVLILTQKKVSENSKAYEEKIIAMIKKDLELLKAEDSSKFINQQRVIEFVKMAENLMQVMDITDEEFIEETLSLTDQKNGRSKRATNSKSIVNRNTNYMKNILSLTDVLLSSSNEQVVRREKQRFGKKIHQFVSSMCSDPNLNSEVIESKFVIFEVSKIYSRHLFNEPQQFPQDKSTVVFSQNWAFPSKFMCMAKVKYQFDMLNLDNNDVVHEVILMDDFGTDKPMTIRSELISEFINFEPSNIIDENSCQTWSQEAGTWSLCEKQTIDKTKIICKCKISDETIAIKYGKLLNSPSSTSREKDNAENEKSITEVTEFKSTVITSNVIQISQTTTASTPKEPSDEDKINENSPKPDTEMPAGLENSTDSNNHQNTSNLPSESIDNASESSAGEINSSMSEAQKNSEENLEQDEGKKPIKLNAVTILPTGTKTTKSTKKPPVAVPKSTASTSSIKSVTPASSHKPSHTTAKTTKNTNMTTPVPLTTVTTAKSINANATDGKNSADSNDASASWTLIILLIVLLATVLAIFLLHTCRSYVRSRISLPMRHPSKEIKYAKYHDEFTMRG